MVSRIVWCVFIAIYINDILDAMFFDGDSMSLNADNAEQSYATQKELVVCVGGKSANILIFEWNRWGSMKEYSFYLLVI